MKVKIEKIHDTTGIGIICLACGKYLGHMELIQEYSQFNPLNFMPVCTKCFSDKIGKPISSDKLQYPLKSLTQK